ncbi:MAG: valine--tRNA ligase [Bacteroidia bacterium]|nr:valine--tRNA ligase [Bacteroidia bacterium]MCF8427723.1 valine--tRNA ligase [Bacteroidia bacterium]MCF8446363.1 valine--tRNA ligase [Bacteroidia bacterium]
MTELAKTYSPQDFEDKWYQYWLEKKLFHAEPNPEKEPYTIVIPPPNVTGVLHMGHMLNNTIQDVLVRKARMEGKNACWVPGTDHASIATEAKVVQLLREQGIKKSDLSREDFLKHAWNWKEKYGGIILEQLKKLGASCDWDRTRFTMEPKLSEAVIEVFIDLYNKGLIYRGLRMVNWDPQGKTALSDEEVIHKEVQSKLYYIKYFMADGSEEFVTIATTRPETILADVAICVNPSDERFKHLVGKKALVPFLNREIPIIADEYVAVDFGTGCLKVTPAHDVNDYALGQKYSLPVIDILDESGFLNAEAKDERYIGKDRFAVRKQIAIDLEEAGHILKIEEYKNQVGTSERTGAVIEPRLSLQWWVDMKKFMERNPEVLDAVMSDEIQFHPAKMKNTYKHWIDNIKDWCISRQLWWGQRIPAWYDENNQFVAVAKTEAEAQLIAKNQGLTANGLHQDEDVLDTWFSSWLWPISVFDGFENPENPDIKHFYPTNDLVTAPEIMFFWVFRMIMAGYEWRGEKPFKNVYYTGIVRDKQRRKMSKSLGNSPDPLDLIAQYGADGVRMGMLLCSPAGNDILFDDSQVEQGRNFGNKIWNAFRLVKGWEVKPDEGFNPEILDANKLNADWFAGRLSAALVEIEEKYKGYRLSEALMSIYKLIWDDFCAWYLEMVKPVFGEPMNESTYQTTIGFFEELMKVLHPFMPFITEEIWQNMREREEGNSICIEAYPIASMAVTPDLSRVFEAIQQIRNLRNAKGISPKEAFEISIKAKDQIFYQPYLFLLKKLANVSSINFVEEQPAGTTLLPVDTDELFIVLNLQVDEVAEREKIEKEIEYLQGFMKSVDAKLSNEKFVANAKPELVEKERQKKADAEAKLDVLRKSLN